MEVEEIGRGEEEEEVGIERRDGFWGLLNVEKPWAFLVFLGVGGGLLVSGFYWP